jgi:hypothetical protein
VVVNAANPPVKDRINSMNAMFCNGNGERRYKVNVARCPVYTDSLEQQVWAANGEPDKSADNDHPNDAGGYFIVKQFPIIKPTGKVTNYGCNPCLIFQHPIWTMGTWSRRGISTMP